MSDEEDALSRYNRAEAAWEAFCAKNPDLVSYMESLLQELQQSLDALEANARREGKTMGPIQRKSSSLKVSPEALRGFMEERGPDAVIAIGGKVELEPRLSIDKLRAAEDSGLLSREEAERLSSRSAAFSVPPRCGLPSRRTHD